MNLDEALNVLRAGGVLAHATETCYGLAVDPYNEKALQRLAEVKQQPVDKPVTLLVADLEEAQKIAEFSPKALELARRYWPGPLTLILPRKAALPAWVNPGHGSVAVRVSSHPQVQAILLAFGGPITSTSANVHGQKEVYAVENFLAQGLQPDIILDSGTLPFEKPSTLVEVLGDELRVLRQGSLVLE